MATFKCFEEIEAWQQARHLTRQIYTCTNAGQFAKDFSLKDQIRRASVSAMSNIAEGFERDGSAEFVHFLSIAKGSTGEVESQLYVALDQNYITQNQFDEFRQVTGSVKRLSAGLMTYLRHADVKGVKFKR